jgi:4-hydroxybenzoate polyprenyltransferase
LAQDYFWHAVPNRAMMVDFREAKILERQTPEAVKCRINGDLAIVYLLQKQLNPMSVHVFAAEALAASPKMNVSPRAVMNRFWRRLRLTLEMVRFEHSVFALPFALTGAMLAWRESNFHISGLAWRFLWIVVAMVAARSAAMAFNRILDADIDSRNRRTANRHLPAGLLSTRFAWGFTFLASVVFIWAARQLGFLCFVLAPVALIVLFSYSFCKRFTMFSHLILGFCLGMAPAAAWIAMRGTLDARILWLTAAVMFWTAGFDVIYACQDYEFDCAEGLCSIPRHFGLGPALLIARLLHVAMIGCLIALIASFHLGVLSVAGVCAVLLLLVYEHALVRPNDLSRVNAAFFTVNGYISILFFVFWAADILLQGRYV